MSINEAPVPPRCGTSCLHSDHWVVPRTQPLKRRKRRLVLQSEERENVFRRSPGTVLLQLESWFWGSTNMAGSFHVTVRRGIYA
ncbi:hypothetical protein OG21DRAFT_1274361 [Imleria badia]|nr:hypothetical protein OG21DRAFT_1274361 [Imleria badia]